MASHPAIRTKRWRRIVAHFLSQGAQSPDSAVAYDPESDADRKLFEDLRARGVVKQDNRGGFYVDMTRYDADARIRGRVRTGALAGAALGAVGIFVLLRRRGS